MTRKPTAYILLLVTACALLAGCSPDGSYMRQRLQYVSDCNRADTVFTARWLPTVDSLVSYFDRHGAANDRMMAHYLKGRVHHDMGESPQALECYQKAAEQADTTRDDCDFYTLTAIYGQMADIFHEQILPSEERQALEKSEHFAVRGNDNFAALKAFELRTRPYYLQNDTDSILYIVRESRMRYLRKGDTCSASTVLPVAINIFLDRQQYAEAYQYMRLFEKESGKFDESGAYLGAGLYDYERGRYALFAGKTDSATIYFQRVLEAGYEEAGYKGLMSVYERVRNSDSIAKYAKLFAAANDASFLKINQGHVHQVSAMYDYGRMQRVAKEREQNAIKILTLSIILFLIALFAFIYFYMNYRKRKSAQHELERIIKSEEKEIESLKSELETIRCANVKLETINEEISGNLEVSHLSFQKLITEKERKISILKNNVEYYKNRLHPSRIVNDKENLTSCEICQELRYFLNNVLIHPSEQHWSRLYECIATHLPTFKDILFSNGTLSESQYLVCCLIRVGFNPSEIYVLTGISKENISNIRKRLHLKILKIDGSPKDFDAFLMNINN